MKWGKAARVAVLALTAAGLVTFGLARASAPQDGIASSHREAPVIADDPSADNTDVYAFRSPDRPNTVTLLAHYVPLQEPAGGPNFFPFGRGRPLRDQDRQQRRRERGHHLRVPLPQRHPQPEHVPLQHGADQHRCPTPTGTARSCTASRGSTTGRPQCNRDAVAPATRGAVLARDLATTPVEHRPPVDAELRRPDARRRRPTCPAAARSSPASATTRSSSTSARSSISPACGRSTRSTSSRCRRRPASTA